MNIQYSQTFNPLKVLVVNPLAKASQLTIVKILSGLIFGHKQTIDLILFVYTNEIESAEVFKQELISCAFSHLNSIKMSSNLPSVSDADVFCFITNFPNPNFIDFTNAESNEYFDSFYLVIKIAHNLSMQQSSAEQSIRMNIFHDQYTKTEQQPRTPLFIADGLIALDILKTFSRNIPDDLFFCPASLTSIAKSILADYLKVQNNVINEVLVWAANDEVFYVEVDKPIILKDNYNHELKCDWDVTKTNVLPSTSLDHTQFNDSWMKKDFIEKIASASCKNPYGCIYKAAKMSQTLQAVWVTRSSEDGMKSCCSIGVISDGSVGTLKGYPYVLPVVFSQDNWNIDKRFEEDTHFKLEIRRINKVVKENHEKLIRYCKKFLEDNVINQAFVADDRSSVFSMIEYNTTPR